MEEAFVALLKTSTAITTKVADRIFPVVRPQGSHVPCLVYNGFPRDQVMTTTAAANLRATRVQVDAWGKTYADVKALERAVNAKLIGFAGVVGGVEFQGIFEDGGMGDGFENAPPDKLYRVSLDFLVWAAAAS